MQVKDEIGNRYGKLIVTQRSGTIKNKAAWICKCDCGNFKIVKGNDLRNGDVSSCGCAKHAYRKNFGESSFNRLYRVYKKDAQEKNREFTLSKENFRYITSQPCFYCGNTPSKIMKAGETCYGEYIYNGIDRLDSNKGYTSDNVVSCCIKCNRAKWKLPIYEFKELIQNIYKHWAMY